MDKRVGLLAGLLVPLLASGTGAQSPSPEPPPWFGGQRIEMPDDGFVVTVPDGWVAFDPDGEEDAQARAVAAWIGRSAPGVDVPALNELISNARAEGVQLMLVEGVSEAVCGFTVRTKRAIETREFAEVVATAMANDERYSDVEPPRAIELPAGPTFAIRGSRLEPERTIGPVPLTQYLVDSDRAVLFATCVGPVRPSDDWLSVIEGYEFLPVE